MVKNILFVTFQYPFKKNAHAKNFIEKVILLNSLNKDGLYRITVAGFNILKDEYEEGKERVENEYSGKIDNIHFINLFRKYPKYKTFYSVLEFLRCNLSFRRLIRKDKYDIIYLYSEPSLLLTLFSYFNNNRYYLDIRGDAMKEFEEENKNAVFNISYRLLILNLLRKVDKVFVVNSEMMKLYNNISKRIKTVVFHNYFNSDNFYYKKNNNKDKKTRFVYCGNTAYYQMLDEILILFKEYYKLNNKSELMLLLSKSSHNLNEIENIIKNCPGVYIKSADTPAMVNDILNDCDIALMLRNESDVNKYSFPTKFAEYLGAGLPVITTKYIHDIYNIINETGFGFIVDIKNNYADEVIKINDFIDKTHLNRSEIADYARKNLSWEYQTGRLLKEITIQ